MITAYEERIRKLEEQKIVVSERIANCGRPLRGFDETLRTALDFLANPWNLWASERLEDKRGVLKLAFSNPKVPAILLPAFGKNRGQGSVVVSSSRCR